MQESKIQVRSYSGDVNVMLTTLRTAKWEVFLKQRENLNRTREKIKSFHNVKENNPQTKEGEQNTGKSYIQVT